MEKLISVLQIILPIFACVALGILAKKRKVMSQEQVSGLQQFAIKFCLPCVLFSAYLTASFSSESVGSLVLTMVMILGGTLWAFSRGRKRYPYHNLPMLFAAQESGMLGIPLFITLFGTGSAYYMGILDLAQAVVCISTISMLSAPASDSPTPKSIALEVVKSPLLILGALGLVMNLTGLGALLDRIGVGQLLTETTGFIAAPISAVMLFSVGYNLSFQAGYLKRITELFLLHLGYTAGAMLMIQGLLFLIPNVSPLTRWALLIYSTLPASYIAPSMGKTSEDGAIASGVCSMGTVVSLILFCIIAIVIA